MTIRTCKLCGEPLPEGCRSNRRYCEDCAYLSHWESVRAAARRQAQRKAHPVKVRVRDPMKRLGLDYVNLRLKR